MTSLAASTSELAEALDTWLVVAREAMNEAHLMAARVIDEVRCASAEETALEEAVVQEERRIATLAAVVQSLLSDLDRVLDGLSAGALGPAPYSVDGVTRRASTLRMGLLVVFEVLDGAQRGLAKAHRAIGVGHQRRADAVRLVRQAAGHMDAARSAREECQCHFVETVTTADGAA